MTNQDYFANESPKKGLGFWITIALMFLFAIMAFGVDYSQYLDHENLKIPKWYFYIIFSIDFVIFSSIILIIMYRKIGVWLFPIAVLASITCYLYYLDTFMYTSVQNLFLIFLALFTIIPKWKFFK